MSMDIMAIMDIMDDANDGRSLTWQISQRTRILGVLKELHKSSTWDQFGVMNTLQKVRERFYWYK